MVFALQPNPFLFVWVWDVVLLFYWLFYDAYGIMVCIWIRHTIILMVTMARVG